MCYVPIGSKCGLILVVNVMAGVSVNPTPLPHLHSCIAISTEPIAQHMRNIAIETPTAMPIVAPGERPALLLVAAEVEFEFRDEVAG
jgi:hypothetical protein